MYKKILLILVFAWLVLILFILSSATFVMGQEPEDPLYENRTAVSIGIEYSPISVLNLRGGYLLHLIALSPSRPITDFTGFGAGIGLKLFNMQIDYSFAPYGVLGNTHIISFSAWF